MEIILEYNGKILVSRYDRYYLRFLGGMMDETACELQISNEEADRIRENPESLKEVFDKQSKTVPWTEQYFIETNIYDYLLYECGMKEAQAEKNLEKLKKHPDIRREFHERIITGQITKEREVSAEGYTAEKLMNETYLEMVGAYNYLVFLREQGETALHYLEEGLPKRTVFQENNTPEVKMDEEKKNVIEEESPAEQPAVPETAEPAEPAATQAIDLSEVLARLESLSQLMTGLQESFDDKIAEDAHKNKLFDNLHKELTRHQNGLLDKIMETMALDVIQLVDSTKKLCKVYEKKEPSEENYAKLLRSVKGIAEDLEDVLYRQDIESYSVPGRDVDVKRQKIIQVIDTDDPAKDNKVAARTADGYTHGDSVLRPERIKIYKYNPNAKPESEE